MSSVDFLLSKRQQKMLAAMLLSPERQFGTNELIALGGPGVGAGRNVIKAFEKSGVVVKAVRGNQLLYSINRGHPIYAELWSICMKTFGIADVVAQALQPFRDRVEAAFIFGSIARGSDRPDSDVDLMVVGDIDVFELGPAVERLQEVLGREVDPSLHTSADWMKLTADRVAAIMKEDRIIVIGS